MAIDRQRLVEEVMWRTGLRDRPTAELAVEATLEALGERLSARDTTELAKALPPSLATALLRLHRHTAPKPTALFARVSVSEGVSMGAAVEHAEVVCRALAGALGLEERVLLARRLPPDWSALFADEERRTGSILPPGIVPGHGHTLATGRPGSDQPLADAHPLSPKIDATAVSGDPHAEASPSSGALADLERGSTAPSKG